MREDHIDKIIETYRNRLKEDRFSNRATLAEIAANDYSLNISRYVDTSEAEERIDINIICDLLEHVNELSVETDKKLFSLSKELNIPSPIGNNIYLLQQYKKGVMQQLFSQEIRFKDDVGNDLPKWENLKLGKLTYKVDKKNKENIKYPIYSINNKEGFLPQSEQFEGMDSNERGYDISLYKIIETNTFAYNPARINVGSIGFSGELSKVIISSLYVCFKTVDLLEDCYLLHYLNTKDFNKSVNAVQEGGVRLYLFYDNFSKITIPLPSNKEQIKISCFLSAIDEKISHCQAQIANKKV